MQWVNHWPQLLAGSGKRPFDHNSHYINVNGTAYWNTYYGLPTHRTGQADIILLRTNSKVQKRHIGAVSRRGAVHGPVDQSEPGFTLVELLVVIAIIGLLAALLLPVLLLPVLSRARQLPSDQSCGIGLLGRQRRNFSGREQFPRVGARGLVILEWPRPDGE